MEMMKERPRKKKTQLKELPVLEPIPVKEIKPKDSQGHDSLNSNQLKQKKPRLEFDKEHCDLCGSMVNEEFYCNNCENHSIHKPESNSEELLESLKNTKELYLDWLEIQLLPEQVAIDGLQEFNPLGFKLFNSSLNNIVKKASREDLTYIIENISSLDKLERLYIRKPLASLPDDIGRLKNLKELYVVGANNILVKGFTSDYMNYLPDSIAFLENLEILDLRDNNLKKLPDIGGLTKLKKLDLQGNHLTYLPDSIGELINLEELYLEENSLTMLPESIVELEKLEKLYLRRNKPFNQLPKDIGKMKNLKELCVRNTKVTKIPRSLRKLNLEVLYINSFLYQNPKEYRKHTKKKDNLRIDPTQSFRYSRT
ncbi:hypothetical protein GF352_00350 [archaeon]|nr:hypothetical protein [archaeon]